MRRLAMFLFALALMPVLARLLMAAGGGGSFAPPTPDVTVVS